MNLEITIYSDTLNDHIKEKFKAVHYGFVGLGTGDVACIYKKENGVFDWQNVGYPNVEIREARPAKEVDIFAVEPENYCLICGVTISKRTVEINNGICDGCRYKAENREVKNERNH